MDFKEYISSGILELYIAGSLSGEEAAEVERMSSLHPEIKSELESIQDVMDKYTLLHQRNPRPELRKNILESIPDKPGKTGKISLRPGGAKFSYGLAASIVLFLMSSSLALFYWSKWQESEEQILALKSQNDKYVQDYNLVKDKYDKTISDLKILKDHGFKEIELKGQAIAPEAFATVYWNPKSNDVFLDIHRLPLPAQDMQYQLWTLVDGVPKDAGVFVVEGEPGLQKMKAVDKADAFAVTLEIAGGSQSPTMDALYLVGSI